MPILKTLPIIINSDMFRDTYILLRHIQPYCGTSKTLYRPCILITLPHSETWRIQTLIYIQNSVKRYPGLIKHCITPILRTLPYSESWKNSGSKAYSEPCLTSKMEESLTKLGKFFFHNVPS